MLTTVEARNHRRDIDNRLNPGFRSSEPARLLADAYALALTVADETESRQLKRDCLDSALQIEEYLLDTLSELRVSKGDVEGLFDEMREKRPGWPDVISPDAWERLAVTKMLRDIGDVVCGGGDYWEAIRYALNLEFDSDEAPVADADFQPRTLYFAVDTVDWKDLLTLKTSLPEELAEQLAGILGRIRTRTEGRFAMVVWSEQDVLDAVAKERGDDVEFGDEATWEQARVDRMWVEDLMDSAQSAMSDRMCEIGWEVLEDAIRDKGLPPG